MSNVRTGVLFMTVLTVAPWVLANDARQCKRVLYELSRPNVTVISSNIVSGERGPGFCRVAGTIVPDVGFVTGFSYPSYLPEKK